MSWTGPLAKRTWLDKPAVSPEYQNPKPKDVDPRRAQAVELLKTHRKIRVAEILGVAKSTITKWCKEDQKMEKESNVTYCCPRCGTQYLHPAPEECDWCPEVQPLPVSEA